MAVKKKGLGRGIDSLIPQTDTGNKKEKVKEKLKYLKYMLVMKLVLW